MPYFPQETKPFLIGCSYLFCEGSCRDEESLHALIGQSGNTFLVPFARKLHEGKYEEIDRAGCKGTGPYSLQLNCPVKKDCFPIGTIPFFNRNVGKKQFRGVERKPLWKHSFGTMTALVIQMTGSWSLKKPLNKDRLPLDLDLLKEP